MIPPLVLVFWAAANSTRTWSCKGRKFMAFLPQAKGFF
jgi:hypothetical protein